MELAQAIRERRSIRRYTDQPVARETLLTLLEAAIQSPSAHNRQPWRFSVITDQDAKVRLATRMGERLRNDLQADGASDAVIAADTARSYARITEAPALILVALSMVDMDHYDDPRRSGYEYHMAAQSVAMCVQNLLLTAHELGLGACWMCAPLFVPDTVRAALELPTDWQPQTLITVGYPAQVKTSTRHLLESKVIWR